jgi:hypothetical protein
MNQTGAGRVSDAASESHGKPNIRTFQQELNYARAPLWKRPWRDAQDEGTRLPDKKLPHVSGGCTNARTITQDGRIVTVCLMARPPPGASANPLALWRQHDSSRLQCNHSLVFSVACLRNKKKARLSLARPLPLIHRCNETKSTRHKPGNS